MPSGRGANPSQRSQDIEDIIDEHCTDNNLIRKVFLGGSRRGAIFYQNAIPDLLEYTEDELNNSLRRIKNQFATPKKSTTNNNKFTSDMMDESVAPNPPSPMKSLQSPDSGNRTPRKRSRTPNNGSSYRERRSSDENDDRNGFQCNFKSHAESSRPQTSPRMFVFGNHAHRKDNVSPLSTLMECASISDSRIAETIINDSNLPEESVALVTDAIEFTSRATVSGGLTTQGVGDGFIRITHEKDHFSRLDKEVTKEKKNRKAIINTLDKAIKAKRGEISVAQTALAGLEEEKFKEETDWERAV